MLDSVHRIEPARLETIPEAVADLATEIASAGALLGSKLHPTTAAQLAGHVRIMNTYYSNLIEGHDTRPKDIERAISGDFSKDKDKRLLQLEALAHVKVQLQVDQLAAENRLPEPASPTFIQWLHQEFYRDAPKEMLVIRSSSSEFLMEPGVWRTGSNQDVTVGRHHPPSSDRVPDFMQHFEERFKFSAMGASSRIISIAGAHHRFNYIHPFPDGNGRVSRLMSHAMAHKAGIGAHGLWSISRGLARGLDSRTDYKRMMDYADSPRRGDLDGRGNLSYGILVEFTEWFLKVCLDQIRFMSCLFDLETLARRLEHYVDSCNLKPESTELLQEALLRGSFERGEAPRITRLPERSARRVLNDLIAADLLGSTSPKSPVSLRFPSAALETLFPLLYPKS